ncbi:MAG: hypothetical protein K0S03_674 [Burkholderiales bacterium]|nr:hypothetical protein [Burkholderiales bacterium]
MSRRGGSSATAISFSIARPQPGQQNWRNCGVGSMKRLGSPMIGLQASIGRSLRMGAALRAAEAAVGVDRQALGGQKQRLALQLLRRRGATVDAQHPDLGAPSRGGALVAEHHAVDLERRLLRHVAVLHVGGDLRRIALERVAEATRRRPQHRVDVGRMLREVLLAQLQSFGPSGKLVDVVHELRLLHLLQHVAVPEEPVAVHGARVAAHHPGRGRHGVARGKRVVRDRVRAVRNEAGLGREPAAPFAGAAGIADLLPVQEQDRKALLGMLDVGQLADGCARLAAGRDAVGMGEGADRPANRVDEDVAVALAPLVDAAEDGRGPLAGAADAHHVAAQLRVGIEHLREHVVGGVERDLHALHRRGGDRGGEVGAVERSGRGVELDVAQRAAHRVVLLPAHELVERHHDRAAPA